nr:MAG TPA: hypothetical protein [Caudoviricetes sp.]
MISSFVIVTLWISALFGVLIHSFLLGGYIFRRL